MGKYDGMKCDFCDSSKHLRKHNGEIKVIADTLNNSTYLVQAGEKIAQLVINPIVTPVVEIVEDFENESARGANGFGSTDEGSDY